MKFMRILALALALLFFAGCVEQLGEIDRTQANALKKTDFYGVWYRLAVITDMPASAGFGFVGQTNFGGAGGKVIFDIQEDKLVVFPVTETVRDGDAKWHKRKIRTYWIEGKEDQFIEVLAGNPVAVYPITSHFDIQRQYSTATGAQSNVLEENTTDRPWFQRKYIRVNWMANQFSEILFPQGSMTYSSADYYPQEHEGVDPNRFHMEEGYFHFTRRLFGQPMSTGACSTYSLASGDCSGATFDVRLSFRRADPKVVNDFEIREYHNEPDAEKFGFFLSERHTYDEDYGLTYRGQDYKAQIWNLWQKSVELTPVKTADGKTISCIQNADCARPSVCDQADWFEPGVCSVAKGIDYSKRGFRPVIYHISADHPVSSLPAIYKVADNWSDVFQETVAWLLFWEEKWSNDATEEQKNDGSVGFTEAGATFGQRYCESHADCAAHALSQGEAKVTADDNVLAIGTKSGTVFAVDNTKARPAIDGGALIMFVNATPDSSPANLTIGSVAINDVAFAAGAVNAHEKAAVMPKSAAGQRYAVQVKSGTATADLINVEIRANRIYFVVYYGGTSVAVAESQLSKKGIRLLHAVQTGTAKNGQITHATGPVAVAGVNGTRAKGDLAFGELSDYLHFTDTMAHAVFTDRSSRGDVSCMAVNGVNQCFGWKQTLTDADRKHREEIKASLPPLFVLCENRYTGANCSDAQKGNKAEMNDCRNWAVYDAGAGAKAENPCATMVPHPEHEKIIGDARYNYIYWVTNPHASSPLGYGPSAADPDTGMLFWGTAYIYGAPLVSYAQWGKDLVDLLNGDLDVDSVASGKYIRDYLQSLNKAALDDSLFEGAQQEQRAAQPATSIEDAAKRARLDIAALAGAPIDKALQSEAEQKMFELQDPKKLGEKLIEEAGFFEMGEVLARMDKIRGTPLERAMINDEVALAASGGDLQPGDFLAPEAIGAISPAGWASPRKDIAERLRMQLLGYNSIYLAEFTDPALIAMAKRLKCAADESPTETVGQDRFGDKKCYKGDALRTVLHDAIYRGVLEHEIGHTVGLRHNFTGSADVLNYFDTYYDETKGREKEEVLCADVVSQFGTVSANNMCEDSLGETCADLQCTTDAQCPAGLACGEGLCRDVNGIKVGRCVGTQRQRIPCTKDQEASVCGNGAICGIDGTCAAKFVCGADDDCVGGEACVGGYCQNVQTATFRTTPLLTETTGVVKKYMPRAAPTAKEIENLRTEYQYSTIMDYGQKINADFQGLGKYDYAAIKYGYGRMVEVFADMSYMRDQLSAYAKNTAQTEEASAWRLRTTGWSGAGAITHPFYYLNNWMPPAYLNKRDAVPGHQVAMEEQLEKYGRAVYDRTYFEVPYKYCSDEYRGGSLACYYFDTGAHMQEIVYHAREQMQEYYLFDAFKRDRLWFGTGGNPMSYMSRVIDRYLLPIGAAARYYAVYNNIFRVYSFFPFYDNHPMYLRALRSASEDAFRALTAILTSPAPGSYSFDKTSNTYQLASYDTGKVSDSDALDIQLGVGKMPWTTFNTKDGYYYANHPAWIGSYWDKLAAIQVMTSSQASFLSDFVGEQLPLFRGTAIGFNTVYPKELSAILGGIAAGAIDEVGGFAVKENGKMVYRPRDPFAPADKSAPRVAPSVNSLSLRLFAAWQAIANLPAGFDPSFTDSMAIWIKGSAHEFDFGACTKFGVCAGGGPDGGAVSAVDYVEFEDPWGKKVYVAPRVNYNKDYFSPTYRMLKDLNDLKSKWQAAEGTEKEALAAQMKAELEVVDYFRLLYKVYGSIGL
ncbi:MAG: hypothetical protein H6747_00240 [Deltaproteobacteria bacterium]|nr:hypothetical protein [Deltaproteobacteria bacterium]